MWDTQGFAASDDDQRAAEAGIRRLEALEGELQHEEEENLQEKARLRAEELKKRNKGPKVVPVDQAKENAGGSADESFKLVSLFHRDASQIYLEVLLLAYRDGKLGRAEEDILAQLRKQLGLTDDEHLGLAQKVRLDLYSEAMAGVWKQGVGRPQDFERLDLLREQLSISAEDHLRLERQARLHAMRRTGVTAS